MTRDIRFYVLQRYRLHGCDALQAEGHRDADARSCEACGGALGLRALIPPIEVELEVCPRGYCDLVYLPHDDFLVSARFKEIYEREGLGGLLGFDPVRIVKLKWRRRIKEPPPAYYRVMAVRSQTVVDQEASGIEWGGDPAICPVCRQGQLLKRWKRLVIDVDTWTGEDIFHALGKPGTIFVSQRFRQVCEEYRAKNAAFLPAEKCFGEYCPWEIADWSIREFDGTLAVLRSWNKGGRFDHFVDAMHQLRPQLVANAEFNWIEELRERFDGQIDAVGDAAAEAHYKLVGMPRPRKV